MAAPTEYYVDPGATADTGSGTVGSPWGPRSSGKAAVQHALDTITRDATNGDRINVKSGTDDVLNAAIDLTTYGVPSRDARVTIQGYTSSAGDGGIGQISGGGSVAIYDDVTNDAISFVDLELHNTGSATYMLRCDDWCIFENCEIHNGSGIGLLTSSYCHIMNCHFHDIGGTRALNTGTYNVVMGCYFEDDTKNPTYFCDGGTGDLYFKNILDCGAAGIGGFEIGVSEIRVIHNSILGNAGTSEGITDANQGLPRGVIIGNLIEGFSGTGGDGLTISTSTTNTPPFIVAHNGYYNNSTHETLPNHIISPTTANESLSASPFKKSGALSFANRFTYFEPDDVGNVLEGPFSSWFAKGAVQQNISRGGVILPSYLRVA